MHENNGHMAAIAPAAELANRKQTVAQQQLELKAMLEKLEKMSPDDEVPVVLPADGAAKVASAEAMQYAEHLQNSKKIESLEKHADANSEAAQEFTSSISIRFS